MEGAGGSTRHSPSLHQSYNGHRTSLLSVVPAPRGASYNGTMPTSPLASPGGPSCVSAFNCFCQSLRGFLGACYPVVPERGQHEEAVEDSTGAAAKTQLLVFRWVGGGAGWGGGLRSRVCGCGVQVGATACYCHLVPHARGLQR